MTDCQRWCQGRASYRPAREVIRAAEFDVAAIADDTTARGFVELHHYSRSYPSALDRFGLYRHGALVGVAVFSYPINDRSITNVFPCLTPGDDSAELGRLVLLDEVAANGESFFVARCFDNLRRNGCRGIVSFSDPVARVTIDGRVVTPGHVGTVYQALNARYLGRGTPRSLWILPDGTTFSPRAEQKIRAREKGWEGAARELEAYGAPAFDGNAAMWLREAMRAIGARRIRHPGNHKYAWALDRRVPVPVSILPYPKLDRLAA